MAGEQMRRDWTDRMGRMVLPSQSYLSETMPNPQPLEWTAQCTSGDLQHTREHTYNT